MMQFFGHERSLETRGSWKCLANGEGAPGGLGPRERTELPLFSASVALKL
jgi:hypothetical protein